MTCYRVRILLLLPMVLSAACSNSTRQTVQDLESNKKEHAQQVVDQSSPVILSIIEESSLDMVNSISFSAGFEGVTIEDQDMDLIDQATIAFYGNLVNDPALIDAQTRLYGSSFTSDELQQIARFYATPAGQKLLSQNSRLSRSIRSAVQARMYEQMPQYMASLKSILKKPGVAEGLSHSGPQWAQTTKSN